MGGWRLTCCSVKMVGLFVVAMIGFSVIYDLWMLLDIKRGLTMVSGGIFEKNRAGQLIMPSVRTNS